MVHYKENKHPGSYIFREATWEVLASRTQTCHMNIKQTENVPWALLLKWGGRDRDQRPFMSAGSLTGHFIWDLVPGTMFHYKWVSISRPVTVLLEISITLSFWAITFKKYDGKKMSKLWPLQFTLHFFRFSVELFIVKNCFHEEAHMDTIGN